MSTAASFTITLDLPIGMNPAPIAERVRKCLQDTPAERAALELTDARTKPEVAPVRDPLPESDRDVLPTVLATLPACPECGAKDRALRVGKTYRPFGPDDDAKVQYTTCQNCEARFKVEWE